MAWADLPGVDIHAFDTLASTQDYLLPLARQRPARPVLCIADHQTHGRGRGNKTWEASPGTTLCFSLCMCVDVPVHALGGVTLAFGVALCHALEHMGAQGLQLKWPNDIYAPTGKLAGILTEVYAEPDHPTYLVVGVGINILENPWADLTSCTSKPLPSTHDIVVSLVKALLAASTLYEREGFAPFHASYDQHDILKDKKVTIDRDQKSIEATVLGVSLSGGLLIDTAPFIIFSGSVRLVE